MLAEHQQPYSDYLIKATERMSSVRTSPEQEIEIILLNPMEATNQISENYAMQ